MTISEPGVVLTDYALMVECAVFVYLLNREHTSLTQLSRWFIAFFCALACAAFIGGTTHGFLPDETTKIYSLFWNLTLICIGVVGSSMIMIGLVILNNVALIKIAKPIIVATFAAYCLYVLYISNDFIVAISFYLPATLFLLVVLLLQFLKQRQTHVLIGLMGLLLTIVAAYIQQAGYSVHPVWLDHNVIYHVVQGIALLLLFYCARGFGLKE